jgi:diacylglycerol kinase (ATP)
MAVRNQKADCNRIVTISAYASRNFNTGCAMESPYKGKTGLKRVWNALFYSFDGLSAAFRHEDAFRQELVLACLLIPTAFFLPLATPTKSLMVSSVLAVLVVELLNSAIEAVTDRVSLEDHALAKRAKDLGSAAVLLSVANVVFVWALALLQ